jgi:hypothetical protein
MGRSWRLVARNPSVNPSISRWSEDGGVGVVMVVSGPTRIVGAAWAPAVSPADTCLGLKEETSHTSALLYGSSKFKFFSSQHIADRSSSGALFLVSLMAKLD